MIRDGAHLRNDFKCRSAVLRSALDYLTLLRAQFNERVDFRPRQESVVQLIAPLYHEDGDMIDIFLEPSPTPGASIRISDYGMTLMRLSYSFELNTPNKECIFNRILTENRISTEGGVLFADVDPELEFQKKQLQFKGFVVHEDFDGLPKKDRTRITSAADKQFVSLDDFRENAVRVLELEAA
ncbi:MAG: DUF1828 domain-containing protein [Thermoleophilia bacterium]|jgi:hypothetical protein